jgi:hypothetical protein
VEAGLTTAIIDLYAEFAVNFEKPSVRGMPEALSNVPKARRRRFVQRFR